MHRLVTTVYWLALVAWFASLVAGAATATSAFTALPALPVEVPSAAMVYPGADDASSRFAAGFVAQPVFAFADGVALIAMPLIALCLILQRKFFHWPARSGANLLRMVALVAAIVLTLIQVTVFAPRMKTALFDYRAAVFNGDVAAAADHKATFDRDHARVDPLARTTVFLLLAGLALSAWTMTPRRPTRDGDRQRSRILRRV